MPNYHRSRRIEELYKTYEELTMWNVMFQPKVVKSSYIGLLIMMLATICVMSYQIYTRETSWNILIYFFTCPLCDFRID